MDCSYYLPIAVMLSLICLLIAASLARRPKKGTLEWIHRAVSPSVLWPDAPLSLKASDFLLAAAAGLAAFLLILCYNYPVMGSASYSTVPVATVLISEISLGISAACSFLFFSRLFGGVGFSFFAAGLTALVTPLLLPCEASAAVSLGLLALLFSTHCPAWLLAFGALCGAASLFAPSSVLFLLFGLAVAVLFSFLEHRGRHIAFYLLSLLAAGAVYSVLSWLLYGTVSMPVLSFAVTYVKSAAVISLIPLVLYAFVRLLREKSFASAALFSFLILGTFFEFTGITVVWFMAAVCASDAFSAVITRGSGWEKISAWVFLALCAASAALFVIDRFSLYPTAGSLISLFSASIVTL